MPVIDKEKIEKIKKAVSGWSMDTPSRDDWTKEPPKEKSKDETSIKEASKDASKNKDTPKDKDASKDAPDSDIEEIQEIEDESSMDVPAHASSANDSVDATSADVSEDASRDAEDATENATEDATPAETPKESSNEASADAPSDAPKDTDANSPDAEEPETEMSPEQANDTDDAEAVESMDES